MSAEQIDLAQLDLRCRRAELWAPALPKGVLTLRLTCRIGSETFAWVAAQAPGGKTGVVREVVVDRKAVEKALRGPVAVADLTRDGLLRINDKPVSGEVVADLVIGATEFTIPIVGRVPNVGVDGQSYFLSLESGFACTEVTWWESGFPEWRPLVEWARATQQRLHEIVNPGKSLGSRRLPDRAVTRKAETSDTFLCPICDHDSLTITCRIELPPELSTGDELNLQIVNCSECSFRGAALYEESRQGSLDSEQWRHYCFAAPAAVLDRMDALIKECPRPEKRRCNCAGHLALGRRDDLGRWIPPVPFAGLKTFPMRRRAQK